MKKHRSSFLFAGALAAGLMVSNLTAAQAQVAATVTVTVSSSTGTIPPSMSVLCSTPMSLRCSRMN